MHDPGLVLFSESLWLENHSLGISLSQSVCLAENGIYFQVITTVP